MSTPVRMSDVLAGRINISRLEESRGWLGSRRVDPAERDPSWDDAFWTSGRSRA